MVYSGWQGADTQNVVAEPAWQGMLGAGGETDVEEGMARNWKSLTSAWGQGGVVLREQEHTQVLSQNLNYIDLFRLC